MKEQLEKKIELRLKFEQREQNSFKMFAFSNNWRNKNDYKNKRRVKRLSFNLLSESKDN